MDNKEASRKDGSGCTTACLGMLYYSQRRFDSEKPPVCAGFSKRTRKDAPLSSEAMPGGPGDFKYFCLGYSAYNRDNLKDASKRRKRHDEPVEVPYCEGLEVISAAAVSSSRELLSDAPVTDARSASGHDDSLARHKRDNRTAIPLSSFSKMDWNKFKERFERMSWRMVDKMQANAEYIARSFARSWQQVTGFGRSGDK